jgi:predicted esterase/tetratricopeptide (TPR) repeat protein
MNVSSARLRLVGLAGLDPPYNGLRLVALAGLGPPCKLRILVLAAGAFFVGGLAGPAAGGEAPQGMYFAKKAYQPAPLPKFAETKDRLPSPIYDENPLYVRMYWRTWELGFRNFYEPRPGSGYVSQFSDAAFNQNIFLWDTCFLTMFCNYGQPLVPGIAALDNFYAKQYEDGEICREINRATGKDYAEWVNREGKDLFSRVHDGFDVTYAGREVPRPPPRLTLDALNHPIFTWAEMESLRVTGDSARLALVYEPLVRYYRALQKYIRQGNGLYMTDWASMDNAPRIPYLVKGGTAVDTSAEMVLFARQLGRIADLLGKKEQAAAFRREAAELARTINEKMWDPERKFYFDLTVDGRRAPAKTIAAFWTLLARVASPEQADALAAELGNPASFGRKYRVPSTPADQAGFDPAGGYWRGAVWPATNTMVIRGLENYGKNDLARQIALEHLRQVGEVFQQTGTVWENYAPDAAKQGSPAKGDYVGWTGIVPILYFIEYGIGLKPDALDNRLTWDIRSPQRSGCERFRFNGHTVSLVAEPRAAGKIELSVRSDGEFCLRAVRGGKAQDYAVKPGENHFTCDAEPSLSAERKRAKYLDLQQAIARDFLEKRYDQAEKDCLALVELAPKDPSAQYNLACARARLGKADQALAALEQAVSLGFADSRHLRADPDLEALRNDNRWEPLLRRAKTLQAQRAKGTYEKPAEMEGVKTIERQPEGGLRYHLRMPPGASKDKPVRLVVWLHPSGGSGNRLAESLALRLNRQGYALLVPNQKQWLGWTGEEIDCLLGPSLSDAGQVEGIDARRPILMGFSAGGQAALTAWAADPGRLGGLILDAAYPIRLEADPKTRQIRRGALAPPEAPAVKSVPIYVLVGEADQGGRGLEVWRKVESDWRKAGVPLVIHPVPAKGHQWLVGPQEADALEAWLPKPNRP